MLRLSAWLLALGALHAACAPADSTGTGRGVLVIAIDGLRADHVSGLGYDRETTPVLDAFAELGVHFTQTFAAAPWVLPAHAALFTGVDPRVARRVLPPEIPPTLPTLWHVPDAAPSLAKEFLRAGFTTACFADHPTIAQVYGFDTGFAEFQSCEITSATRMQDLGIEGVSTHFEQWLKNRGKREDWFAYMQVHDLERAWSQYRPQWDSYFEPRSELSLVPSVSMHDSVFFSLPRTRWQGEARTLGEYEAKYDGAIRRIDKLLGRLFAHLKQLGRLDTTTIVVVGAYGSSFGENGLLLGSGRLTDVDLHVPCVLKLRRGLAPASRKHFESVVSTVDLAPTLLELEGIGAPGAMTGRSLVTLLRGEVHELRSHAVASSGIQEGWVVIDDRFCYERTYPGRVDELDFARTWFGDELEHREDLHEVLHERGVSPDLGHRSPLGADSADAERLRAVGEEEAERVEALRRRWQSRGWLEALQEAGGADSPR